MRTQKLFRQALSLLALNLLTVTSVALAPSAVAGQTTAARPRVRTEMLVSTAWLSQHLADDKVVVLHVAQQKSHYDAGHIPGARFLSWSELVTSRDGNANELPSVEQLVQLFTRLGVGNTARIVLYGDNTILSAARAYFTLDYLGQGHRTAVLDGGLEKWKAEGLSLAKEDTAPKEAAFEPAVNKGVVTDLQMMRTYSTSATSPTRAHLAIIDGRPEEQFIGDPNAANQRSGHIPGAVSLFWVNQIVGRDNPALLPPTELQSLFEKAGVAEGDKVITYCNSGVQASQSYFVAKYLGYDASMYDGSFSEWNKAEGTKVVTGKNPKP